MTRTVIKKKKALVSKKLKKTPPLKAKRKPAAKKKLVVRKIRKKLTGTAASLKSLLPHVSPVQAGRSHPRTHSATIRAAYYTMGAVAFGFGMLSLGYLGIKNMNHEIPQKTLALTQAPIYRDEEGKIEALATEFKSLHGSHFQDKIAFWSEFVEKNVEGRKKLGDLVAGHKINDTAELIPSRYDCTTYVETVIALARSENPDDFYRNLIAIRYRNSVVSFTTRNHFPELDWIPNNQKAKILTDITIQMADAAGVDTKVATKKIDRVQWLQAQVTRQPLSRKLASMGGHEPSKPAHAEVSYIGLAQLKNVAKEIPSGTVVNLVHRDDGHHPVLITHQGFVIRRGEKLYFRHASKGGKIKTVEFFAYLHTMSRSRNTPKSFPLLGVNFVQVNDSSSVRSRRIAEI